MPGSSTSRTALVTAAQARLLTQGYQLDESQISALIDDIEVAINTNSSTVLADVAADLGIFTDPPVEGQ